MPVADVRFVPGSVTGVAYLTPLLPGQVLLFDYRQAVVTRVVQLPQALCCMDVSPDGVTLAAGAPHPKHFFRRGVWKALHKICDISLALVALITCLYQGVAYMSPSKQLSEPIQGHTNSHQTFIYLTRITMTSTGGRRGSVYLVDVDSSAAGEADEHAWMELRGHRTGVPIGAVHFLSGGEVVSAAGSVLLVWRPEARLGRQSGALKRPAPSQNANMS